MSLIAPHSMTYASAIPRIFDDSHGATRLFIWHPHQKGVASCLLQMLDRVDQLPT